VLWKNFLALTVMLSFSAPALLRVYGLSVCAIFRVGLKVVVLTRWVVVSHRCVMCRAEAHQLYARKPIFDAMGVQLVAVLNEYMDAEVSHWLLFPTSGDIK
jgi:hypothetical protein